MTTESVSTRAARWAVRAEGGTLTPSEERELDRWLAADSRHLGAYVRARARCVDLERLAALHGSGKAEGMAVGATVPLTNIAPLEPGGALEIEVASRLQAAQWGLSRRQLLAAGVACVGVIGAGLSWNIFYSGRERYESGIGEVRRIALEDGSTLTLNTASEVLVRLTRRQRDIRLVRGEALFEVAHDKSRPFVVRANDTSVRAVGTAFAVRLEPTQVDVTVTDGVVEVADSAATASSRSPELVAKRVSASEQLVIANERAPVLRPVAPDQVDRQLAWRDGMVSFDGESLQAAVAEINRHNRRQIVVVDPTLGAKPVVGIFRTTDLDGFCAAAAVALKLRAVSNGDVIRLESEVAKH